MANLIITVLAIALVAAAAISGAFYFSTDVLVRNEVKIDATATLGRLTSAYQNFFNQTGDSPPACDISMSSPTNCDLDDDGSPDTFTDNEEAMEALNARFIAKGSQKLVSIFPNGAIEYYGSGDIRYFCQSGTVSGGKAGLRGLIAAMQEIRNNQVFFQAAGCGISDPITTTQALAEINNTPPAINPDGTMYVMVVVAGRVNLGPFFTSTPTGLTIPSGTTFSYNVTTSNTNPAAINTIADAGSSVSGGLSGIPAPAVNASGTIEFTDDPNDSNTSYTIRLQVSDDQPAGTTNTDFQSFVVNVSGAKLVLSAVTTTDFGSIVAPDDEETRVFRLANQGTQASGTFNGSSIELTNINAATGTLSNTSTCGAALAPGASCQITIRWNVIANGTIGLPASGAVDFVVEDSLGVRSNTLALQGNTSGFDPIFSIIDPAVDPFTLDVVASGAPASTKTSACQDLLVENIGFAAGTPTLAIASAGVLGSDGYTISACTPSISPCSSPIAPSATCNLGVQVTANRNVASYSTLLTPDGGGPSGTPGSITLEGTASGFDPNVNIVLVGFNAGLVAFAPGPIGGTCGASDVAGDGLGVFSIANNGFSNAVFTVDSATDTNLTPSTNYDICSSTCSGTLSPGSNCTVEVALKDISANGTYAVDFEISGELDSTPGGGDTLTETLSSVASGFDPVLTPFVLTYNLSDTTPVTQTATITNTGFGSTAALNFSVPTATAIDNGNFSFNITADTCDGATLAPSGSCTIDFEVIKTGVTFIDTETIDVSDGAITSTVTLNVRGIAILVDRLCYGIAPDLLSCDTTAPLFRSLNVFDSEVLGAAPANYLDVSGGEPDSDEHVVTLSMARDLLDRFYADTVIP